MKVETTLLSSAVHAIGTIVAVLFLITGCGGGGGGGGGAPTSTSVSIVPFKGKFVSGNVSLTDANGNAVILQSGTDVIDKTGIANIVYDINASYPLIVSVTGNYLDEVTGTTSTTSMPLRGLIPYKESITQVTGIPVTALTEMAVVKLLKGTVAGLNRNSISAVDAITVVAKDVLGEYYSQAFSPPVFDINGKTTDVNTLKLAALVLVANNLGSGADLSAKINDLAQKISSDKSIGIVIQQSDMNSAIASVNGGATSLLPAGASIQVIPAYVISNTALGVKETAYNGYASISASGAGLWKVNGDLYSYGKDTFTGVSASTLTPLFSSSAFKSIYDFKSTNKFGIKNDNSLWSWANTVSAPVIVDSSSYIMIADAGTGSPAIAAIKTDGSLWTWGTNYYGEAGGGVPIDTTMVGTTSKQQIGTGFAFVVSGYYRFVAIKTDGTMWAWGYNGGGYPLGIGGGTHTNTLVQIGSGYVFASASANQTFAIKTDGTLWAWGVNSSYGTSNPSGYLGDGTSVSRASPVLIGTNFKKVSAAYTHTLAVKTDGSLWVWGKNTTHELGMGLTTDEYPAPVMLKASGYIDVASSNYTGGSIGLKEGGNIWVWGKAIGLSGGVTGSNTPMELATQRIVDNAEVDALNDYPISTSNNTYCSKVDSTGSVTTTGPYQTTKLAAGPCAGASSNYVYNTTCNTLNAGSATVNLYNCAMKNSTGSIKTYYTALYQSATQSAAAEKYAGGPCDYFGSTGHYNSILSCIPGAPTQSIVGSLTGLTSSQTAAAAACATASYDNPQSSPYDPQFDSNCQLAQFDACLHKATGMTTYDQEGRDSCAVTSGFIAATGSTASCRYCPYPY